MKTANQLSDDLLNKIEELRGRLDAIRGYL